MLPFNLIIKVQTTEPVIRVVYKWAMNIINMCITISC